MNFLFWSLIIFVTCVSLISFSISSYPLVYADSDEPVYITISSYLEDNIKWDGKWSFETEWKHSALKDISLGNDTLTSYNAYLRTAHQNDYIYVMINMKTNESISNDSLDVSKINSAYVCFNSSRIDKSLSDDDYDAFCFVSNLKNNSKHILGFSDNNDIDQTILHLNKIGFIGVGGISDEFDRYDPINAHPVFEFRIPIDLIGRNNVYDFLIGVQDSDGIHHCWPCITPQNNIPTIDKWGMIISPDKSLPEFGSLTHFTIFLVMMSVVVICSNVLWKF